MIQKGWVSAAAMKKWAWLNFGLAILFGVPAFLHAPLALTWICGGAVLGLSVLLMNRFARWGASDIALVFLFGPLLTSGIALASFGVFNQRDLVLGAALGTFAAWVLQARQFENLFRAQATSFRTFLGFWNFDRARKIFLAEGVLLLLLQPAAALSLKVPLKLFILLPLVSIPSILFMGRLKSAASPLSSQLVNSDRWALGSHLSWTLWWILALGVTWL